ncbi:hypothetical protein PHMEG_00017943 [Phytophthora megakarya]|uniref:WRKY19-like zinc finger domain-containing protein n=1 Tax=Phytophthora megakarya TaxID=4795 RepID=A0A225VWK8_9STRA|nr:hypothetical protein PHMEG_00017943 [Phytophthora megakarya]
MISSRIGRKASRCSAFNCNKQLETLKFCKVHGGARCRAFDCVKFAQSGGLCVAHRGGRRCGFDGCSKLAQYKRLCLAHGGGRRFGVSECQKFAKVRGLCKAHAKNSATNSRRPKVAWEVPAGSQFDVHRAVVPHEYLNQVPTNPNAALLSATQDRTIRTGQLPGIQVVISQDPAMRVFTARRPWIVHPTMFSHIHPQYKINLN